MNPEMAAEFTRIFKALGFKYVTLDLEGFRSGSMNAMLPVATLLKSQVLSASGCRVADTPPAYQRVFHASGRSHRRPREIIRILGCISQGGSVLC